jgi:hypothetical protein
MTEHGAFAVRLDPSRESGDAGGHERRTGRAAHDVLNSHHADWHVEHHRPPPRAATAWLARGVDVACGGRQGSAALVPGAPPRHRPPLPPPTGCATFGRLPETPCHGRGTESGGSGARGRQIEGPDGPGAAGPTRPIPVGQIGNDRRRTRLPMSRGESTELRAARRAWSRAFTKIRRTVRRSVPSEQCTKAEVRIGTRERGVSSNCFRRSKHGASIVQSPSAVVDNNR